MKEIHKIYLKSFTNYLRAKGYKEESTARRVSQVNKYLCYVEKRNESIKYTDLLNAKSYLKERCRKQKKASIEDKRYILAKFYDLLKRENIVKENIFNRENIYGIKNIPVKKLTLEQEKILNKFIHYEKNFGKRKKTADAIKLQISWYFNYLNENGLHYLQIKISEAENLQAHLLGLKDDNGQMLYASATINNKIGSITYFYEYLIKKELIMFNPFKEIKKVRKEKTLPRNILDEEKLNELLSAIKNKIKNGKNLCEKRRFYRHHVMAELMYSTGARINEVLKLREEDFNLFTGTVKLLDNKTGKERTGFLNSYVIEILHIYLKFRKNIVTGKSKSNHLFNGEESVKRFFNKDLQTLCKELGLGEFKSHNLRHSFACHLLRAGCDIRYIQAFLGHTRLATTQIYTKIEKNDLRSVLDKFHPRAFKRQVKAS